MRLIDADALMQSLGITNMGCDKCAWHHDKEWSRCKRGGDFEDACSAIEDAPTIEPESQWIPCGERLPEDGRVVLWCNEHGSVFATAITARKGESWAVGKRHRLSKIIAWMPLPKPYKGDEHD